jgi:hypothetical protein
MTKTAHEVVHQIVTDHGPILGRDVEAACVPLGYKAKSIRAVLFNAKKRGSINKDDKGFWTAPPTDASGPVVG